jgi:hypothetical protein
MPIPQNVLSPDSGQENANADNGAADSPANGGFSANSDAKTDDPKTQSPTPQWPKRIEGARQPEIEPNDEKVLTTLYHCGPAGGTAEQIAEDVGAGVSVAHALTRLTTIGFAEKSVKGSVVVYAITKNGHNRLLDRGIVYR